MRAFFALPRSKEHRGLAPLYSLTMKNALFVMLMLGTGAVALLLAGRLIDTRNLGGGRWDIAISVIVVAAIAVVGILLSRPHLSGP